MILGRWWGNLDSSEHFAEKIIQGNGVPPNSWRARHPNRGDRWGWVWCHRVWRVCPALCKVPCWGGGFHLLYMSSVFSFVSPVISEFLDNQWNPFEPSAARHFLFLQMNQSPLSDVVFHSFLWFLPWCRLNFSIAPHQIAESKVIVSPLNMLKIVKGESRF